MNKLKLLGKLLGWILGIILIISVSLKFINFDGLIPRISDMVTRSAGSSLEVKGRVKLELLPLPAISLDNVVVNINKVGVKIEASELKINISLLGLITNSMKLDNVTFFDADAILTQQSKEVLSLDHLDAINLKIGQDNVDVVASKTQGNVVTGYAISIKDDNFTAKINNPSLKSEFNGKFNGSLDNWHIKGESDTTISDLNQFVQAVSPTKQIEFAKEQVSLKSYFTFAKDFMELSDITLTSNNLQAQGKIATKYTAREDTTAKPTIDTSFTFTKCDLDNLIINKNVNFNDIAKDVSGFLNLVESDSDLFFMIDFKSMKFMSEDLTSKINFKLGDSNMELYEANLKLDEQNKIELFGNIIHNDIRPIFKGYINAEFQDLSKIASNNLVGNVINTNKLGKLYFASDVVATPQEMNFFNFISSIDETRAEGSISLKASDIYGNKVYGHMNLKNANFDAHNLTYLFPVITQKLSTNNNASPLLNYAWLRELPFEVSLDLSAENIILLGHQVKDYEFFITLRNGIAKIENLKFIDNSNDFTFDASVDLNPARPKVFANLTGKKLDYNFINKLLYADKITLNAPKSGSIWSSSSIPNVNFDQYDGNITVNLGEINGSKYDISNFVINARLKDSTMVLDKFYMNIFDGSLSLSGSVLANPINASLALNANNVDINEMLSKTTDIENFAGRVSISGSLITKGDSPDDLIKNMDSSFSFTGIPLTVRGIDLNKVVDNKLVTNGYFEVNEFKELVDSMATGSTDFYSFSGKIVSNNGIFTFNPVSVLSSRVTAAAGGSVDLRNWLTNFAVKFAFVPKEHADSVYINANLTGNLNSPKLTIDTSDLESYLRNLKAN